MSGLPSGYKQLEYIESSGTQFIDTGIKAKNNTKVIAECNITYGTNWVMILGSYDTGAYFSWWANATNIYAYYGSQNKSGNGATGKQTIIANGSKWSDSANSFVFSDASFTAPSTMYLFSVHNGGSSYANASMKLYACQIYDDGTLVRNFIPCRTPNREIGLWDDVNGVFYGNAGTGTFTAGPEVIYEPATPTNFTASVSGQTVALSWAAAANAAGYRLKRDGVQIAEQTGTTYTDTVPDGTTLCTYALTAYNDAGESAAVTLLVFVQLELVTDRTRADVANQTDKGFYNASDLNRVGAAVEYIAGRFAAQGYAVTVHPKTDWTEKDIPTAAELETYRHNIAALRGLIAVLKSTPETPETMRFLDYLKANDIERILLAVEDTLRRLEKTFWYSGEIYSGESGGTT